MNLLRKFLIGAVFSLSLMGIVKADNYSRHLNEGYNLISIPYQTEHLSLEEIFEGSWDDVLEIKGETKFYSRELPDYLNTLKHMNPKKGYSVKMESGSEINLVDLERIKYPKISINEGWNCISYPFENPMTLKSFFGDNFDSVSRVEHLDKFYDSSNGGTLNHLDPMNGYWVNSSESFVIPEPVSLGLLSIGGLALLSKRRK